MFKMPKIKMPKIKMTDVVVNVKKLSKDVTKFNFDGTVYDDSVLYGPLHNLQPDPDPHNYKDFLPRTVIEKYKHFDGL